MTRDEVQEIIDDVDTNRDGKLNYEEVCKKNFFFKSTYQKKYHYDVINDKLFIKFKTIFFFWNYSCNNSIFFS